MHVPNGVRVYGSDSTTLHPVRYKSYRQTISISRSHLKALDQPSERCVEDTKIQNVSACIAEYIEGQMGCSVEIQGSGYPKKRKCKNVNQLNSLSKKFYQADANAIYKISGCLSSCEKTEYQIKDTFTSSLKEPFHTRIEFEIMDGSYQEMEQYILYEFDSFIADVGGFMGLLLGFSVLGICNEIMDLFISKWKLGWIFDKNAVAGGVAVLSKPFLDIGFPYLDLEEEVVQGR